MQARPAIDLIMTPRGRLRPIVRRTLICCGAESDAELGIDLKGESRHLTAML
jgi:hypothetical protein